MAQNRKPLEIDRRQALAIGSAALASAALPLSGPALAQSPLTIGDIKVTTFSDGHLTLPMSMIAGGRDGEKRSAILKQAGYSGETYRSPLNVTLIQTGKETILVDVGSGPNFMSSAGKLAEALSDAGVDPESVTKVVYTHAHPDHIWGTVNDFDELSFPNAACYMSEVEHAFWMADDALTKVSADRQAFVVGAQRNIRALEDRVTMVKPGQDIVTGVRVIDTAGHTPGHISVEIGNGNDTVMVLGDAMTNAVLSFQYPEWHSGSDQEPDRAVETRKALLKRLAANKSRIIGYHLPVPGTGMVKTKGAGYIFEAAS